MKNNDFLSCKYNRRSDGLLYMELIYKWDFLCVYRATPSLYIALRLTL